MVINKVVWYFMILLYNPHFKFLVTYFQFNNFPCFLSVSDWFHVFVCMHAVIGLKHFHYLSLILNKCFSILKKKEKNFQYPPLQRENRSIYLHSLAIISQKYCISLENCNLHLLAETLDHQNQNPTCSANTSQSNFFYLQPSCRGWGYHLVLNLKTN